METKTIVSNVLGSNTHILVDKSTAIIFDAGAELDKVKECVAGAKVEAIFLTHLHFDHIYFLSDYVKCFGCKVYLYDSSLVGDDKYTLKYMIGDFDIPTGCYESVNGVENIVINGIGVKCVHTPGHSADSMCYVIGDNMYSGDTLFLGTIGRTDLPTSSRYDMLDSLERLKGVEFDMCYSGHGDSSTRAEQIENIKYFLMEL